MKTSHFAYTLIFLCFNFSLTAQIRFSLQGSIKDSQTNEPIAYANVYNKSTQQGAISNIEGYFSVPIARWSDTLEISFLGYTTLQLIPEEGKLSYNVNLVRNTRTIKEVVIQAVDDNTLYRLLGKVSAKVSAEERRAKALFQLKSFIDNSQIELIEGYYNATLRGPQMGELELKAGRLALQPREKRSFISVESSRAILMLNLFKSNPYFPANPLMLGESAMRKMFRLDIQSFDVDGTDTILHIAYEPKSSQSDAFMGEIWVNPRTYQLQKITLLVKSASRHPFVALFRSDSIAGVDMSITVNMQLQNKKSVFHYTYFDYQVNYLSRKYQERIDTLRVRTEAVLYAYKLDKTFNSPLFDLDQQMSDYRKIMAFPHNDFFWNRNYEYRLGDSINTNEQFYNDLASITNRQDLSKSQFKQLNIFEHPYRQWSEQRVAIRPSNPNQLNQRYADPFLANQYNLVVQLFADLHEVDGQPHIISAAIFDPYNSFFHLPMDAKAMCFINLYFDLWELERRQMEKSLFGFKGTFQEFAQIYKVHRTQMEREAAEFLKSTQRGTQEVAMRFYNEKVRKVLGIDNIALFNPYP
ncbi:MAG TPA: carboxypeptidase-like regulatory domain-containing protein [Luteibaculaceae bacterium]|nr:carboxypeptidase-like regulatory domain-containing protein [Luteibaculaceae bacterium]